MPNTTRTTSRATFRSTSVNTTNSTTTSFNTSVNTTTSYSTTYGTSRGTGRTTTYNTYYNTSHSTTYNSEWSVSTSMQTTAQTTSTFNTTYYTTLSQNTTIFTNTNTTINTPTTTFSVSTTGPVYRLTNFFRPKEVSQTNLMLNLDARVSASNATWRDQSGNSRNATVSGTVGVSDRCVALYNFHSDATDLTGNHTGTESNITYSSGNYGQAAVFNGSSSYIQLTSDVVPDGNGDDFSISCYVKFDQIANQGMILSRGTVQYGVNNYGLAFGVSATGQIFLWRGIGTNATSQAQTNQNAVSSNTWHHLVCTYNGATGAVAIYIDKVSQTISPSTIPTGAVSFAAIYDSGWYAFGQRAANGLAPSYLEGDLDQVRMFNKSLSSSEVTQLYNENSSTFKKVDIFNDALIGRYDLDSTDNFYIPQFITDQNFTIGGWFYRATAGGSAGYETLWSQGFAPSVRCQVYGAAGASTGNRLYIYLHNGSSGASYNTNIDLPTGEWFHLMKTYDLSAGTVKVYLNSALKKTQTVITGNIYSSGNSDAFFRISKNSNNNSGYLDGKISQVRVYDSVLTDTQIVDDYSTHDYLYI